MHDSTAAGGDPPLRSPQLVCHVPVVLLTWVHEILRSSILGNLRWEDHIVTTLSICDTSFLHLGHLRAVLIKVHYQAFFGVLIDSIVELLVLIIKPFDNQTES
jgi:hypothetical protein